MHYQSVLNLNITRYIDPNICYKTNYAQLHEMHILLSENIGCDFGKSNPFVYQKYWMIVSWNWASVKVIIGRQLNLKHSISTEK